MPERLLTFLCMSGHADGDTFINKRHSVLLHEAYAGDKNLITFEGDHNALRPTFFYTSVLIFFHNVLRMKVWKHDLGYVRLEFANTREEPLNRRAESLRVSG